MSQAKASEKHVPAWQQPRSMAGEAAIEVLADIMDEESRDGKRVNLSARDFAIVRMQDLNLAGFNFSESRLRHLARANLARAKLYKADLINASLYRTNLSDAGLSDANCSKADFERANLSGARISNVDFAGASNLHQGQIDEAMYEDGKPPKNLPNALSLKTDERTQIERHGRTYLVLPEEKREKRPQ